MNKSNRLILTGLAIFALSSDARALTLAEIETRVRRNVRDTATDTSLQRFTTSVLTDAANDAQREVVNATWCLEGATTVTLSAGTTYYDLPATYIAAIKVYYTKTGSSQRVELEEKTRAGFVASNPNWETTAGTPAYYYIRQSTTATVQQIAAIPPVSSSSAGTLTVEFYAQPTDMSDDADVALGEESWLVPYHDTIVHYMTARIKTWEGDTEGATLYFGLYDAAITQMREKLGSKPNYKPSFKVSTPGR